MKTTYYLTVFSCLFLFACGQEPEQKSKQSQLYERITSYEDSLAKLQKDPKKAVKITSLAQIELINRLTTYSRAYPKDTLSADCLFKIHMIYEQLRAPLEARAYADTLLERFPKYKNRSLLLESLASSYDINSPRDTTKVRYYFNLLLQEPQISKQQKLDINKRLANIALTFEQYITQKN